MSKGNDICPCGSGKKARKCCGQQPEPHPALLLDHQLSARLRDHAHRHRAESWMKRAWTDLNLGLDDPDVFEVWFWKLLYYHYDGSQGGETTIFDEFLSRKPTLTAAEKTLVWGLRQARNSIFKVVEIEPGRTLMVEDMFCPEQFLVVERSLAHPDMLGKYLLLKLTQYSEDFVINGMYVRPMAAWRAQKVIADFQREAEEQEVQLTPDRLRQPFWVRRLSFLWRKAFYEMDEGPMSHTVTPEGEEVIKVRDRYKVPLENMTALRKALAAMPDLVWRNQDEAAWNADSAILAYMTIKKDAVIMETNSMGRAGRLGETLLGLDLGLKRTKRETRRPEPTSDRELALHFADQQLPALDGLTPRQAVATPAGRQKIEELLGHLASMQSCLPPGEAFDLNVFRRELGLPYDEGMLKGRV